MIVALRALEFSLEEISEIIAAHEDEADILVFLERQKGKLKERVRREKGIVSTLDRIIQNEKEARKAMSDASYAVEERQLDPMFVAGVRMRGRYSDCGKGFAELARRLGRWIGGKPLCLYYDGEYREQDADIEPCFQVRKGAKVKDLALRELPGGRFVCLLHRGPYEDLGRSYSKALEYAKERGYEVLLPTREVYIKGPGMIFKGNPKKYLTEIQLPIRS